MLDSKKKIFVGKKNLKICSVKIKKDYVLSNLEPRKDTLQTEKKH